MSYETLREAADASKAWPFEEARKLIARLERSKRNEVVFETGYGPSGLRHNSDPIRPPATAELIRRQSPYGDDRVRRTGTVGLTRILPWSVLPQ